MLLHVHQRELISGNNVENVILKSHCASYIEVIGPVVFRS